MNAVFSSSMLFPALTSLFIVLLTTPLFIRLAKKLHLVDDPKTHIHPAILHKTPIPKAGGVPIFLGIALSSLFFLPWSETLFVILLGALFIVVLGILDDKYDLPPLLRLICHFLIALLPILGGINVLFVTNPLGGGVFSFQFLAVPFPFLGRESLIVVADLIALIWIVWTMQMLNWSSGIDGQMPGIATVSAITIGLLSLRFSPVDEASTMAATLAFITAAACLGFLFYNFNPAKIFPGDSGMVVGYMLAVLSILSGAKLATALLVMGVPTIDALFTLFRRISQGKSPFKGDRGHFHHLLLARGLSVRQVAIFYWILSALLGIIALSLSSTQKFFALIAVGVVVTGGLVWLTFLSPTQKDDE